MVERNEEMTGKKKHSSPCGERCDAGRDSAAERAHREFVCSSFHPFSNEPLQKSSLPFSFLPRHPSVSISLHRKLQASLSKFLEDNDHWKHQTAAAKQNESTMKEEYKKKRRGGNIGIDSRKISRPDTPEKCLFVLLSFSVTTVHSHRVTQVLPDQVHRREGFGRCCL